MRLSEVTEAGFGIARLSGGRCGDLSGLAGLLLLMGDESGCAGFGFLGTGIGGECCRLGAGRGLGRCLGGEVGQHPLRFRLGGERVRPFPAQAGGNSTRERRSDQGIDKPPAAEQAKNKRHHVRLPLDVPGQWP